MSRRAFIKGLLSTAALAAVPCGLLIPHKVAAGDMFHDTAAREAAGGMRVFRNACPCNCYDTCSMLTYVRDGVVQYVEGAPESSFTGGALCVKGYTYPRRLYSPDRIKYPMVQDGRGTGRWRRISWDEALHTIAVKLLDSKQRDGTLLGAALTKYSGNLGISNYVVEGMFSSLGYTTRFTGNPCWSAGLDAQCYDMGKMWCNDPEDLPKARCIIVWGANPAWCSTHSMKYLFAAQDKGAELIVIDPLLSQTAAKADVYVQLRPATDGALALGMARHILDANLVDEGFIRDHSVGFADFARYLRTKVTVEWAAAECGVPAAEIRAMAERFAKAKPATIWMGYGLQRHPNGGAMVRAIDALVAMTGNIGVEGGGARYGQMMTGDFAYHAMQHAAPEGSVGMPASAKSRLGKNREVNINATADALLNTTDPPIRLLWVSGKNPFAQEPNHAKMVRAFAKPELIVCVEQFFTETVRYSDIVLPATTLLEEDSLCVSYWHYWLGLNEQAVAPLHESKSNTAIAVALSQVMNALSPGSCTFPQRVDSKEWLSKECNATVRAYFGIGGWEELRHGPVKAKMTTSAAWPDRVFATPSGKYEFKSDLCARNGLNALPVYVPGRKPSRPFQAITPHTQFGIHSQFVNLDWMEAVYEEPLVYINPREALARGITNDSPVRVFNDVGEVCLNARLSECVPANCVVMYEAWFRKLPYNVQNIIDECPADMGAMNTGQAGLATHAQFVDIESLST
ncbi:MAG: molybdopterin-dependent oxidoreductase [Desulfovibrionaceae bacterium]